MTTTTKLIAELDALASQMAEQWEAKFRKTTTDISCAVSGLTAVLEDVLDYGRIELDMPATGDEMRFNSNARKGYITFKADRIDGTEWKLVAEAVGEFHYDEEGKETGHRQLDMPKELTKKIIVRV